MPSPLGAQTSPSAHPFVVGSSTHAFRIVEGTSALAGAHVVVPTTVAFTRALTNPPFAPVTPPLLLHALLGVIPAIPDAPQRLFPWILAVTSQTPDPLGAQPHPSHATSSNESSAGSAR